MYSDEEIQDLLNTMSFNTNNPNDIYGDSELSGDMQIAKKEVFIENNLEDFLVI